MSNSFNTEQGRVSRKHQDLSIATFNGQHDSALSSKRDREGHVPTGTMRYGNKRRYESDMKVKERRSERAKGSEALREKLDALTAGEEVSFEGLFS